MDIENFLITAFKNNDSYTIQNYEDLIKRLSKKKSQFKKLSLDKIKYIQNGGTRYSVVRDAPNSSNDYYEVTLKKMGTKKMGTNKIKKIYIESDRYGDWEVLKDRTFTSEKKWDEFLKKQKDDILDNSQGRAINLQGRARKTIAYHNGKISPENSENFRLSSGKKMVSIGNLMTRRVPLLSENHPSIPKKQETDNAYVRARQPRGYYANTNTGMYVDDVLAKNYKAAEQKVIAAKEKFNAAAGEPSKRKELRALKQAERELENMEAEASLFGAAKRKLYESTVDVVFTKNSPLGITWGKDRDGSVDIHAIKPGSTASKFKLRRGLVLVKVQGKSVVEQPFKNVMKQLEALRAERPLKLRFMYGEGTDKPVLNDNKRLRWKEQDESDSENEGEGDSENEGEGESESEGEGENDIQKANASRLKQASAKAELNRQANAKGVTAIQAAARGRKARAELRRMQRGEVNRLKQENAKAKKAEANRLKQANAKAKGTKGVTAIQAAARGRKARAELRRMQRGEVNRPKQGKASRLKEAEQGEANRPKEKAGQGEANRPKANRPKQGEANRPKEAKAGQGEAKANRMKRMKLKFLKMKQETEQAEAEQAEADQGDVNRLKAEASRLKQAKEKNT